MHLRKIYRHRLCLYPRNATTTSINPITNTKQIVVMVIVIKVIEVAEVIQIVLVALEEVVSLIALSQNTSGCADMETMYLKFAHVPL